MILQGYEISKAFAFDAAHRLDGLPDGHKCSRPHGHTYTVIVTLGSEHLDDVGMVLDYGDLAPVKTFIDTLVDHRNLNEVFPSINPTAERLAFVFTMAVLALVPRAAEFDVAVTVKETPGTAATYRVGGVGAMSREDAAAELRDAMGDE